MLNAWNQWFFFIIKVKTVKHFFTASILLLYIVQKHRPNKR
jgi:hypothetical protein